MSEARGTVHLLSAGVVEEGCFWTGNVKDHPDGRDDETNKHRDIASVKYISN